MGHELIRGPPATGGETDDRLLRCLHFERERELSAECDEVESEGPCGADDEERAFDDPLELHALRRRQRPPVGAYSLGVPLEEVLELALVGRRAAPHGSVSARTRY